MVERAYSLEVKKTISAFEAQKYSLEGRLNSEKILGALIKIAKFL